VEKDRKKTEEHKPLKDRITEEEKSWLLQQAKELVRQAEENGIDMDGVIMIPGWLQGNELREYLIEQYLIKYPDLDENKLLREIEDTVQTIEHWDETPSIEITRRHWELALTDVDELRRDLMEQYRRVYPEKADDELIPEVEESIELLKEAALVKLAQEKQ